MKPADKNYLISLKNYIYLITFLFIISLVVGIIITEKKPDTAKHYFEMFGESFGWITELNPFFIIFIIFLRNALISLVALVSGVLFGILPVYIIISNGIMIGIIANFISKQQGALFVVISLLPHGIIEIPMILISASMGLQLGYKMYLVLRGAGFDIKMEIKKGVSFYLRWIAPMLFIAAFIETLPIIISRVLI